TEGRFAFTSKPASCRFFLYAPATVRFRFGLVWFGFAGRACSHGRAVGLSSAQEAVPGLLRRLSLLLRACCRTELCSGSGAGFGFAGRACSYGRAVGLSSAQESCARLASQAEPAPTGALRRQSLLLHPFAGRACSYIWGVNVVRRSSTGLSSRSHNGSVSVSRRS